MESDEGFRLVFFFQGLIVLLYRVLNGAWRFVDSGFSCANSRRFSSRGRGCLGNFSSGRSSRSSLFGFFLQTLGFTLAATHFTWIVRRAAVFSQGADRSGFDNRCSHFGNNRCFNHWSRLGSSNHWLGDWRFKRRRFECRSFNY